MSRVAIVGAGAWGTALALQAIRAGHHTVLVARDAATVSRIAGKRENVRLPGVSLPDTLEVRQDLPFGSDLLLWVVPTQHLRSSFSRLRPPAGPIVVCAKGVETETYLLPLEVLNELSSEHTFAILTGPCFAHEVARGCPTAAVVASTSSGLRDQVRLIMGTNCFRLYGNDDPIGAQLGGAAKNVIAIAAGVVIGAGLGENARAALVTRGLSELGRLATALNGRAETVMGLSGMGDLLLTCTGPSSRNFSLGYALGKGQSLSSIIASQTGVIEGVPTAAALVARAKGIEMPVCGAVAELLAGRQTVNQAIAQLLSRPQGNE